MIDKVLVSAGKVPDTKSLSSGWLNAFKSLGHECEIYDGRKPAFDVFDTFQPDILWVHGSDLTRELTKAIIDREGIKIILFVDNWENASNQEEECVNALIKNGHSLAFNTSFTSTINHACKQWNDMGLRTLSCLPAADFPKYSPAEYSEEHASDISYISCYQYNKDDNFTKFIAPLIQETNIKIFGYGSWPTVRHLGSVDADLFRTIVCSSKINLSVSHDEATGPSERIYKILSCGRIPLIHQSYNEYAELFPMAYFFKTKAELLEKVKIINDGGRTQEALTFARNNTYINRVEEVLGVING